jgi:hypothetical protein
MMGGAWAVAALGPPAAEWARSALGTAAAFVLVGGLLAASGFAGLLVSGRIVRHVAGADGAGSGEA